MKYKSKKKAVAIEYGQNPVPLITAKAEGATAQAIIDEAERQGVYIAEDPQLVELLGNLELKDEIPEHLYVAVAIILSWAYWLKGMEPSDNQS
jgi:flagellar biosynthesis protein